MTLCMLKYSLDLCNLLFPRFHDAIISSNNYTITLFIIYQLDILCLFYRMSAISSIPTMAHQNTVMSFDTPPPFMPSDPYQSAQQYSNNTEQTLNSSSSEKGDDTRQKEIMQESMRLQRLQGDDPTTPQQPYQFQGPMPLQLKYTFRPGQKPSFPATGDPDFDGRRLRRTTMRKTVDYNSAIIRELEVN